MAKSLITILIAIIHSCHAANMNDVHYRIANGDTFEADFSQDREFFDVYTKPIRSLYGQVHWTQHGDIPLPPEIVQRFAGGKVMAITGYEVDQVMQVGDQEVPVPITWAYNHHYYASILNSKVARMVQAEVKEEDLKMGMSHGAKTMWQAQIIDGGEYKIPQVQLFSEGNGGEMRKSYHGYPRGYAQLIQSPDTYHNVPMQIDVWNREMTNATFIPGPLPRNSRIPASAGYSGLIECPCTDRLPKEWHMTYSLSPEKCKGPIVNASECFFAAQQVIPATEYTTRTIENPSGPPGCTISIQEHGSLQATWNEAATTMEISSSDEGRVVGVALGVVNVTISLKTSEAPDAVDLILTGPADRWFAVGFGASSMCIHKEADECPTGGPYAVVVFDDRIEERKLDFHGPGSVLQSTLKVVSDTEENGIRRIQITRSLKGDSSYYFSFDPTQPTMNVILATGCGMEFAQHCGHGAALVSFLPVNTATKLCQAGIHGTIGGNSFDRECAPFPRSDVLVQGNPTCWIETYQGGLECCRHDHFLLDQDQEIPWPDQPLEYRLKYRFYFEEYQESTENHEPSHLNLVRLYLQTEAYAGEYDIPQCSDDTPPSQCVYVISSRVKVVEMLKDCPLVDSSWCTGRGSKDESKTAGIQLIYAGPHCHAPSCLSMELYNADTGRLLCRVEPSYGTSGELYDEKGFLTLPPCLWGDLAEGLQEPILLPLNTTLLSIKRNNSTLPHTGEMASWQMRGVVVPRKTEETELTEIESQRSRPLLRSTATKERQAT